MQLHLTTKRFDAPPSLEPDLRRHLDRLARRLRHFAPDLVHLDATIEWHPRKRDYTGSFRLSAADVLLPVRRNRASTLEGLLDAAFDDLEEQLIRFLARLRREASFERRRASLSDDVLRARERALLEERELLDRALAGDREAFDRLVTDDLPEVETAIAGALRAAGREVTAEAIRHVLADVLAEAAHRLPEKPARWTMPGWLTWLARRQIRRETSGLAVAQSAPSRS
jgi:hypothetical protein